jgi:hypothetical protein
MFKSFPFRISTETPTIMDKIFVIFLTVSTKIPGQKLKLSLDRFFLYSTIIKSFDLIQPDLPTSSLKFTFSNKLQAAICN